MASPAATRIEFLAPYYRLHCFRLAGPEDVGEDLRALLAEAYGVGEQRHLTDPEWPVERAQVSGPRS